MIIGPDLLDHGVPAFRQVETASRDRLESKNWDLAVCVMGAGGNPVPIAGRCTTRGGVDVQHTPADLIDEVRREDHRVVERDHQGGLARFAPDTRQVEEWAADRPG